MDPRPLPPPQPPPSRGHPGPSQAVTGHPTGERNAWRRRALRGGIREVAVVVRTLARENARRQE